MAMPSMSSIARKLAGGMGSDAKFFSTTKKGEIHELRQELNHHSRDKKKDAVKKVIANMTVGKDVSMLFTDVVNCMQTADTQLKKLVYLYLINYAKSNPDLAILAVNTFVKDANDSNPLIRALSVRTMGCIRVDRITEYLCEPLRRCLQDDDPYVRKTASICVAKLFDINPDMVEEQGFLDILRDLISDSNPTVVANAVAALSEIAESGGRSHFKMTKSILQKLLAALNECTEWGQVFVLDALSHYTPSDAREAEAIIDRITPRLQHANSAVVLSAVKVIIKFLEKVSNADTVRSVCRKLAPPLVTLLSTQPEIQYVALRNINLIVQRRPQILSQEIKVFFCKYNDPIYVKMEKLEIIIRLVSDRNLDQVLLELKEYATEVDVDFVRKSVRAIGRCAIKLDSAAERAINVLLELIDTKVNYILQEAIVVIKDIFRKYPNRYESIIGSLCENLEVLDEPEAKASMIWILGEYAARIENAEELLDSFVSTFSEETPLVQLTLLTAVVKCFLHKPQCQDMVQNVLALATEESDNPDLRDRGYVYWRLLSSNPQAAASILLNSSNEKPPIQDSTLTLEPPLLTQLLAQLTTLSSVYHKLPPAFITSSSTPIQKEDEVDDEDEDEDEEEEEDSLGEKPSASGEVDLLDMGGLSMESTPPSMTTTNTSTSNELDDFFGGGSTTSSNAIVKKPIVLTAEKGKGVEIRGSVIRENGVVYFSFDVTNVSLDQPDAVKSFAIQLNKSSFGLVPITAQFRLRSSLSVGETEEDVRLGVKVNPSFLNGQPQPNNFVQVAIKNLVRGDVCYFQLSFDVSVLFAEEGCEEKSNFISKWKEIDESKETYFTLSNSRRDLDEISRTLHRHNVFYVAKRNVSESKEIAYYSFKTMTNIVGLVELTLEADKPICVCIKTDEHSFAPLFQASIEQMF